MTLKSDAKFEENLIFCFKNDKNLVNFDPSTQESQKFSLWLVLIMQSIYCLTWKVTEELSFMTVKTVWGMWGMWDNVRNLADFHQSTWKCQNWDIDGILLSKVENASAKNLQRSYVYLHWRMMENLKKNWLIVSKLTWEIWRILTQALKSLKDLHFIGLLLTKVYIFWAKKVQRSYLSLHLRVIQNLKKNWLVVWKMTWAIWQIFTRALERLKIGTLIGSFCPN